VKRGKASLQQTRGGWAGPLKVIRALST